MPMGKKLSRSDFITKFVRLQRQIYTLIANSTDDQFDAIADLKVKVKTGKGFTSGSKKFSDFFAIIDWGGMLDFNYGYNPEVFTKLLAETTRKLKKELFPKDKK